MLAGAITKPQPQAYKIGAYYFPNFHVDPRNELVHGRNWTEWEIVKRGEPKFAGHQQPKRPLWGMEDESLPSVFEKKIAAAHSAGLNHFIFDWYWYQGQPFLERALEKGYLNATNKADVKFCLMWANHDWFNIMPARLYKRNPQPTYSGSYNAEEFDRVVDYVISRYFHDSSYFQIDGAPYFSIYELKNLIDRMGGVEIARKALDRFRAKTQAAGFPDLHLNAVAWGATGLPDMKQLLPSLGVRSVTSYTWFHHYAAPAFPATEYRDALEHAPEYWRQARDMFGVPYHIDVSMGWDPSPRTCQSDTFQKADYPFTPILKNNHPELFQEALTSAKM